MSRRLDWNHGNPIIVTEDLFEFVLAQEALELLQCGDASDKILLIKWILSEVTNRIISDGAKSRRHARSFIASSFVVEVDESGSRQTRGQARRIVVDEEDIDVIVIRDISDTIVN